MCKLVNDSDRLRGLYVSVFEALTVRWPAYLRVLSLTDEPPQILHVEPAKKVSDKHGAVPALPFTPH